MTPAALKGKIQTVLGPIAPEALGRTLMHEHVLCDIRPPATRGDNDLGPEITLENVWQINHGHGIKRAGRGVIEVNSDFGPGEFEALEAAATLAGRPLSCLLVQVDAQQ